MLLTFRFHPEFAMAGNFLNQGGLIDGRPVITHSLDFEHANEAFELAGDKRQALKGKIIFGA